MKAILLLSLAILASAALAGCSSAPAAGPVVPPLENGMYVIRAVAGNHFKPVDATVPVGATVNWIVDVGVHDVTDADHGTSPQWKSQRNMTPGGNFTHTFTAAGTYHYRCDVHESLGMTGTITVA